MVGLPGGPSGRQEIRERELDMADERDRLGRWGFVMVEPACRSHYIFNDKLSEKGREGKAEGVVVVV